MAEQRPTVEFATNVGQSFRLKFAQPYKSGENNFGAWHLWTMADEHGVDVSLFAKDSLNNLILAAQPYAGMDIWICKAQAPGDKAPHFELSKAVEGEWVKVESNEPRAAVPAPSLPIAPAVPGPSARPSQAPPPASKEVVTIVALVKALEQIMGLVWTVCEPYEPQIGVEERMKAVSTVFIAATRGGLAPLQTEEEVRAAVDKALEGPELDGPGLPEDDLPF